MPSLPFWPPFRRRSKRFATWQVELTTRCGLRCAMCVKEGCEWERHDMAPEGLAAIIPYLADVESVVLEGWGESLLYPDLPRVVRLVRGEGARPGFVTSGMGFDEGMGRDLVAAGLDFLGFSFSGAMAATHNSIRVNSDFDCLVEGVRIARRLSESQGRLKIHIVFLMLKGNMDELPAMVELAHSLGVREMVAINIVQISNRAQDGEKAFSCTGVSPCRRLVDEALRLSRRLKINLVLPRLEAGSVATCSENPLRNLYISAEGEVAPCVYLHPPVASPFPRIFCGEEHRVEKVSFGNIFRQPLDLIWNTEGYREFRHCFEDRERAWKEVYAALFEARLPGHRTLPDPPIPCRACHKILGL
jgi:MoaA/NifB/PqqE/SkfB family radical SAM enzyme